jgi:two-component system response regulator HydG
MTAHEKKILEQVLAECGWNKKMAARRLGISRNTLYLKLNKYQISKSTTH